MVNTQSKEAPTLKTIGALRSHNTSNISYRKECEKEVSDKPVSDEGDDAIASHQKSTFLFWSHIGQEKGQTKMMESPSLKIIGALLSQNTSNTSSRRDFEKNGTNKQVQDEGDDAIASHQKSMFLVQSHLVQEEGQTKMVASPALKIIGASLPHNNSYTSSRKECEKDGASKTSTR